MRDVDFTGDGVGARLGPCTHPNPSSVPPSAVVYRDGRRWPAGTASPRSGRRGQSPANGLRAVAQLAAVAGVLAAAMSRLWSRR